MNRIFLIVFILGLVFLQACKDDDATCTKVVPADKLVSVDKTRLAKDVETIDAYLTANSIVAQAEPQGTRYVVTSLGTGETPCLESRVTVKYVGKLLVDPTRPPFDQSATGVTFPLQNLILGWQLVLPLIPLGSKITLYIPSGYAYGTSGGAGGKIPSNANLIFEMELIAIM